MADSVLDVLNALAGVSEDDILAAEHAPAQDTERIKIAEPPSHWLNPVEPDFVLGYDVDLNAMWDAYKRGENILIVGPTGSGKSSLAYHMLDKANESTRKRNHETYEKNLNLLQKGVNESKLIGYKPIPYEVSYLGCGAGTRTESLIGTLKFRATDSGREPYTVYGAIVNAYVNGMTGIIDEIDFAPPDIWGEAHVFLDGRTQETTIYVNGPETIRRNSRYRVIATANTFGMGENQLEFAGTQLLNTAFLNRFTYKVLLNYLQPDKETVTLTTKVPGMRQDAAAKMVEAAGRIREAKKSGVLSRDISTRDLLSWSRECIDREKRVRSNGTSVDLLADYWDQVVVPAALPTYLTGHPNGDVIGTYLELR